LFWGGAAALSIVIIIGAVRGDHMSRGGYEVPVWLALIGFREPRSFRRSLECLPALVSLS